MKDIPAFRSRSRLAEPAPALEVAEHDPIDAIHQDQLEVTAPKWVGGRPAIFHQPLLADRHDLALLNHGRHTVTVRLNGHGSRTVEAPCHPYSGKGVSTARRSGIREP